MLYQWTILRSFNMKMIIVIIKDTDAEHVTQALTANDFRVTRIASTGGFLRS